MSQSEKLNIIFENIDVLVSDKNYMVLPNETPQFFKALADARILSYDRLMVAWDILTYKHDEKNPFPSHEKLMRSFKVGKRAITNAVSEIVKTGLFINEKGKYGTDKRKNTYNVSPFLNLLGSFIEAVRENRDVCIKELYQNVVSGNLKARKVSSEKEAPKKKVGFSESINEALSHAKEEHKDALKNNIQRHLNRLDEETIIFYIKHIEESCTNESKFYAFATTCFKNANNGDKQKHEQRHSESSKKPHKGNTGRQKPVRTEHLPDWFEESKERDKQIEEYRSQFTYQEVDQMKAEDKKMENKASEFVEELYNEETGRKRTDDIMEFFDWLQAKYNEVKEAFPNPHNNMNVSIYNSIHTDSMLEYKLIM